jgi:hypothetical protein
LPRRPHADRTGRRLHTLGGQLVSGRFERRLNNMIRRFRNYYVVIHRDPSDIHLCRWRVERKGEPMGVSLEGRGFISYNTAVMAARERSMNFLSDSNERLDHPAATTGESSR